MTMVFPTNKLGVRWRSHAGAAGFTPKLYSIRGSLGNASAHAFNGVLWYQLPNQPVNLNPIAVYGDYLIATTGGNVYRYHIINETWELFATITYSGVPSIGAVAVIDNVLWLAGSISTINGNNSRLGLASFDGSAWTTYDTTTVGPRPITSLTGDGSTIYVGRSGVSSLPTTDPALALVSAYTGGSWTVLAGEDSGSAMAMTMHNGDLVVGGIFGGTTIGSGTVAFYDGSWTSMNRATGDGGVTALLSYEGELLAGGSVVTIGGTSTSIGRWDGSTWHPIASPGVEATRLLHLRNECLLVVSTGGNMRRGFRLSADPFDLQWQDLGVTGPTNIHPGPSHRDLGPVPVP